MSLEEPLFAGRLSPEERDVMTTFRRGYRSYRSGGAHGARGELSALLDLVRPEAAERTRKGWNASVVAKIVPVCALPLPECSACKHCRLVASRALIAAH